MKKLRKGVELNGRTYKNHLDGFNLLDYLSGKVKESVAVAHGDDLAVVVDVDELVCVVSG